MVTDEVGKASLTDEEKVKVRILDQGLGRAKFILGDVEYQITLLLKKREEAIKGVELAAGAYEKGIIAIAEAHGISTKDPSKGKWNFDSTEMTFTRTA